MLTWERASEAGWAELTTDSLDCAQVATGDTQGCGILFHHDKTDR